MKKAYCTVLACISSVASLSAVNAAPADLAKPREATVTVDASKVLRTMDPQRLGGTNVALWYFASSYDAPQVKKWVSELHPRYIRIPGGSYANGTYWNGNGVRGADGKVDPSKVGPDGYPAVDYSGYAPSFLVDDKTLHPSSTGWHGNVDVKKQQDWIKSLPGIQAMACPNAGTGRAIDAAEWVKWANKKMDYDVRVWEIGNELGGSWEAGNDLPFGKGQITGAMYTKRYNDMADAMHKQDPTIKIGSCPFVEEALRDCGSNVDFVSIHTYPGSTTLTDTQMFSDIAKMVESQVNPVKGWIHKYQPQREKEIEIAYSEWNLSGGLDNANLFSGLWSSIFLGELAKNGVSMANEWDLFVDLVSGANEDYARKSEYYALWLWNNYMGNRLIPASSSDKTVFSYASRTDHAVTVMLVNTDKEHATKVNLRLAGFTPATIGELATVSSREYYYSPVTHLIQWSTGPRIERLKTGDAFSVTVAPYSMTYVRVPDTAQRTLSAMAKSALSNQKTVAGKPELRFVIPSEMYAGDSVSGQIIALSAGSKMPYGGVLAPARLTADGDATFDRSQVRLAENVGHFTMKAATAGVLTLTARSGGSVASFKINVKPSVPRPIVFWDFSNPLVTDKDYFGSSYSLNDDQTQRANRSVARIDLPAQGANPDAPDKDKFLLSVGRLPKEDKLNKANIRGVIVDMKTSPDFVCDDPNAVVLVTMQGTANWWMKIGTIPLKDAKDWKSYQLDIKNDDYFKALPTAGNVLFVLQTNKAPKGSVYFDKIGFMVR
ncbi:MAG TPA: hypothetical protein VGK19_24690 [Capsulimonadaceae bacterium]